MTNTLRWLPEITARATVSVPTGHGRVGFVDPADIAAVAFAALTEPGHTGRTHRLTGPELLSTAEAAARLGDVLGAPVEHRDVTDTSSASPQRKPICPSRSARTSIRSPGTPDLLRELGARGGPTCDILPPASGVVEG